MKSPEQQVSDLTSVLEVTEQMHQKAQAEHRAVRAERDRLKAALEEAIEYMGIERKRSMTKAPVVVAGVKVLPVVSESMVPNLTAYLREREGKDA